MDFDFDPEETKDAAEGAGLVEETEANRKAEENATKEAAKAAREGQPERANQLLEQQAKENTKRTVGMMTKVVTLIDAKYNDGKTNPITEAAANAYFSDLFNAMDDARKNGTPENFKKIIDLTEQPKYRNIKEIHKQIMNNVGNNPVTRGFAKVGDYFTKASTAEQLELQQRVSEMNEFCNNTAERGENLPDNVNEQLKIVNKLSELIAEDFEKKFPDLAEKGKAEKGETTWKSLLKLAILLGSGIGLGFYAFHLLTKEFSGCYKIVTGGAYTKLSCDYDDDKLGYCSCGGTWTGTDGKFKQADCQGDNADYPPCKCNVGILCSSDISADGAISYSYRQVGPIEALGMGLAALVKPLADNTGLGDIGKYFKYILIGIAVIVGLAIVMKILKMFFSNPKAEAAFRFRRNKR